MRKQAQRGTGTCGGWGGTPWLSWGVKAISSFLERSMAPSHPSGLCPNITASERPPLFHLGQVLTPLPAALFIIVVLFPGLSPMGTWTVCVLSHSGLSGMCQLSLGAFSILSPAFAPGPGTKKVNKRIIVLPAAPYHPFSPYSSATKPPIFSCRAHGCTTKHWPMRCVWKSYVWPSRKCPYRERASPCPPLSFLMAGMGT